MSARPSRSGAKRRKRLAQPAEGWEGEVIRWQPRRGGTCLRASSATICTFVFSTKDRQRLIQANEQERVWAYLGGIARSYGAVPLAIGGTLDHVHVLAAFPATLSIAKFVNVLKSNSSKWMNEQVHKFAWQSGYGAFSVSSSNLAVVTRYIEDQEAHHRRRDSRAEFIALLKKHGVPFDSSRAFE